MSSDADALDDGLRNVEVRNQFDGSWSAGFEVVEVVTGDSGPKARLRRKSDGSILPKLFSVADVRTSG